MTQSDGTTPVEGAEIEIVQGINTIDTGVVSGADGTYTVQQVLPPGDYSVTATKIWYSDATPASLTVVGGTDTYTGCDIQMDPMTHIAITGTVVDVNGASTEGVKLILDWTAGTYTYPITVGADGRFSVDVQMFPTLLSLDVDPVQTPKVAMLTPLEDRTWEFDEGLGEDFDVGTMLVSIYGTLSGKVVTTDASTAAGYTIVATNNATGAATSAVTGVPGTYSIDVPAGDFYTITAKKPGYVTMPGPRVVNVVTGTTYPVGDFTASPGGTISGILKRASDGTPIYNGVVQSGAANGDAVLTEADGAFSLPVSGCGGAEIYGDAINFQGKRLLVTGPTAGLYKKDIALVAQDESAVGLNGDMEALVGDKPAPWLKDGWGGADPIDWFGSPTAKTGLQSLFYTTTATSAPYDGIWTPVTLTEDCTYNFYFRTKADAEVLRWQPLFEFRNLLPDSDPGYVWDGFVSNDPAYYEYAHTPPYDWHSYFNWFDRGNTRRGAPVRVTPPPGPPSATSCSCMSLPAAFCLRRARAATSTIW